MSRLHTPHPTPHRPVLLRSARLLGAAGGAAVLLGPLRSLLALSWDLAVGLLLAFALLGLASAALVRRTEPAGAPRQGQRFETTYDGVRVVGVERLRGGGHALQLAWDARHHIELDGRGGPLGVTNEGPGTCTWRVPGRGDHELLALRLLGSDQLSLTEHARLETGRPCTTRRVLVASSGVRLDLRLR